MGKTYRAYLPEQELLLPPSLRDWLPEGHLAYFVSDVVDQLAWLAARFRAITERVLTRFERHTRRRIMRSVLSRVRPIHLPQRGLLRRLALASSPSHRGLAPIANPHAAEETHNREQKPGLRN